MKEKNGQLIITDIFVHLVSRWSPLILTVLTNQFIKIVNVTQSYLVQLEAEGPFLLPLYFAVLLLEVNTALPKDKRADLQGRWDLLAGVPHGFTVQNPKDIFVWFKPQSGRDSVCLPHACPPPSNSFLTPSKSKLAPSAPTRLQETLLRWLKAGNHQRGGFWFGIYRTWCLTTRTDPLGDCVAAAWHREAGWEKRCTGRGEFLLSFSHFLFHLSPAVESPEFLFPVSLALAVFPSAAPILLRDLYS